MAVQVLREHVTIGAVKASSQKADSFSMLRGIPPPANALERAARMVILYAIGCAIVLGSVFAIASR